MSDQPGDNQPGGGRQDRVPARGEALLSSPESPEEDARLSGAFEHRDVSPEQALRRKRRSRASMATAIALFIAALLIVVVVLGSATGLFERQDYHGGGDENVDFTVADGQTTGQIATELESQQIVADASYFVSRFQKRYPEEFIQPGQYQLKTRMSSDAAIDELMERDEASHYAAIAQTQRMDATFKALAEATGIGKADFEALSEDTATFGIPEKFPTLEGWLHPGEYRFPLDASAEDVIRDMVDRTRKSLEDNGVAEDRWFEVLTVGSIVEFEGNPDIYAEVAGAIDNRIENPDGETSGYIQSDATVTYGLNKKSYHITEDEKRDKSNPYNTYAHKGLPVGPIGSPGDEAIKAAADPDDNDYYYWVTVNLDTGETKFSKTYEQHQRYVEQYQQWCSEHEDKCSAASGTSS